MRALILPLFMLLISSNAFGAASCSNILNQLVILESQIQNKKLPNCEDANRDHCYHRDVPYSDKSFLELQNEHNALMGKLVIYEGLIALGKSIEADHKSIQTLEVGQLNKAQKHIDDFLTGYKKAALLTESMDANFWTREDGSHYDGESAEELSAFIGTQCNRDEAKIKAFCTSLQNSRKEEGVNGTEIFQSLKNFALADSQNPLDSRDKESTYEDYKSALTLKIAGVKIDFKNEPNQIAQIKKMRSILEKSKEGITEADAKWLAQKAKSLDGVSANYGSLVNPKEKFESFFNDNIKNSVAEFNQASRALLKKDSLIENMEKVSKLMGNSINSTITSMEKEIKDSSGCNGSGESLTSCFEKLCNAGPQGLCKQDPKNPHQASKLQSIKDKLATLPEIKRMKDMAESAKACMEKPVTDSQSHKCTDELKAALQIASKDRVNEIKAKVHQLEAAMENMNYEPKMESLKMSKAMGLMALKHKGCLPEDKKLTVNSFKAHCSVADFTKFSQEAIQLGEDAQKILDFSNNPYLNENLSMSNDKFTAYKNEFLQRCDEGKVDQILCSIYETDEAASGAVAQRIQKINRNMIASKTKANRLPAKADFSKAYQPKGGQAFLKGFGQSMIVKGVPFYMQYEMSRSNHKHMMNYHKNRLTFMQAQADYFAENPTIKYYTYPWMNYGWPTYDYNNASSFGGSTSATLYKQPYDFSTFNFAPSMVMDQFGTSSFNTTAPTSGFNFSP